ncbi:MAG: signal recognition particle protein [Alphaproteobacteria bacterium]|nr:signal recognition particle protein [Alphaproteobacteria bacterium]MEC7942434.1 signal recognition particle protein [Pseudomonadota bacterium]MEC8725608.1 signal recognition particle protein [Pseudomonadota bacterium]
MFDGLTDRFGEIFDKLKKRGALSEADVSAAMREIRVALLEADVALPVVKDFIDGVKIRAVGEEVLRSVTPGQQVVKIVNDYLVEMLGPETEEFEIRAAPPAAVMMVGLQGSGKTTTSAKLAKRIQEKQAKKVLMASLDVRRPAAQQQLAVLGEQAKVDTLPIIPLQTPRMIADRAMDAAKREGYDVVVLDTAGRLHVDDDLMVEVSEIRDSARPAEVLLVADAMTGQDAVNVAQSFNEKLELTGIVLTRVDGDARGGAALSMKSVTGTPIRLLGTGEKLEALEAFHPDRIASRILGMGDVVSLVEKANELVEQDEAERLMKKIGSGHFDLDDFASQLRQLRKMGGLTGVMGMLPGVKKAQAQMAAANVDDKMVIRQEAIIGSMTVGERKKPDLIKASRKRRIAAGSGTTVQDVNRLLKQYQEMTRMMKKMKKMGNKGLMRSGMPGMISPGIPPGHGMR